MASLAWPAGLRDQLALESVLFSPGESLDAEGLARGPDFLSVMNGNAECLLAVSGR